MKAFPGFRGIILLALLLLFPSMPGGCDTIEILMPSRLNFPSWVLDSLRKRIGTLLAHEVSLHLLPISAESGPVDVASVPLLLIEEGTHLASVAAEMRPTPITLHVFWMLGTRMERLAGIASAPPATLREFYDLLEQLRLRNPDHYPWFESLEAPLTLYRLRQAMRKGPEDVTPTHLQNALDRKWLNPYSLESDESLAHEVFEAGDAVFSSLWVPGDAVASSVFVATCGIRFSPFPGPDGPTAVPHIRLRLWANREDPRWSGRAVAPFLPSREIEGAVFLPCDILSERLWVKREGSRYFNRLIEGEP
ncbi:MAG TPA: hypothetical protein PLU72_03635 [Candidatus Ozemobacteraceae bacterium]|nr:hypothetical protein [Candidatus Ozemobacteraceae bacterium]